MARKSKRSARRVRALAAAVPVRKAWSYQARKDALDAYMGVSPEPRHIDLRLTPDVRRPLSA